MLTSVALRVAVCAISCLPIIAEETFACDQQMRKCIEALQAWRRTHNGQYPDRLSDLINAGLMPIDGGICPAVLREAMRADPAHSFATSRGEGRDPAGTYEYELSAQVLKSEIEKLWMPANAPPFTRQDLKAVLLQREFSEQVPILRCSSHRIGAPPEFAESPVRNIAHTGTVYWSSGYWELNWLDDVPYPCREVNVLFGLKGPPFNSGRAPSIPGALDLRAWSCAFGDHSWTWTYPYFDEGPNRQKSPHLNAFFMGQHGRALRLGGWDWWIDGLVQLQGRIVTGSENRYRGTGIKAYVSEKKGVRIDRKIRRAAWLQGTVWTAPAGDIAGWLIWNYSDGTREKVPLVYGKSTARFWGDLEQIGQEQGFPEPVWKSRETAADVGKERSLRLYLQTWENLRPGTAVSTLDFVSNPESYAAPFLIAVSVAP